MSWMSFDMGLFNTYVGYYKKVFDSFFWLLLKINFHFLRPKFGST